MSWKKKESLRKTVRDRRVGRDEGEGFHFLDLWARRMHVTLRARCRFHRVISSYFTLSAAASFLGISVTKDARLCEQAFPFIERLFLEIKSFF